MGDGNVSSIDGRGIVEVALNIQGFPRVDVRWLAAEFDRQLGLQAFVKHSSIRRGRQPILALSCHSARKFVALVRPHMSAVFAYKVPIVQTSDKRVRLLKYRHVKQSLSAWAAQTGLQAQTIRHRLLRGWSVKKALTVPIAAAPPPKKKKNNAQVLRDRLNQLLLHELGHGMPASEKPACVNTLKIRNIGYRRECHAESCHGCINAQRAARRAP